MKSIINQIKNRQSGFTIVELLVVIVVIGILASITIVAYNGVTARANLAAVKATASSVQKKAEAYFADGNSTYPTTFGALTTPTTASWYIASTTFKATAVAAADGTGKVNYMSCTSPSGYAVQYWDFVNNALSTAADRLYIGGATSASTCTIVAS